MKKTFIILINNYEKTYYCYFSNYASYLTSMVFSEDELPVPNQ